MCLMIASSLTGCSMEAVIQHLKSYLNFDFSHCPKVDQGAYPHNGEMGGGGGGGGTIPNWEKNN